MRAESRGKSSRAADLASHTAGNPLRLSLGMVRVCRKLFTSKELQKCEEGVFLVTYQSGINVELISRGLGYVASSMALTCSQVQNCDQVSFSERPLRNTNAITLHFRAAYREDDRELQS